MSELERQLTEALRRLSAQSATEQRRRSAQVEAWRRQGRAADQGERHLEAANQVARREVKRLTEYYGIHGVARPRGPGW